MIGIRDNDLSVIFRSKFTFDYVHAILIPALVLKWLARTSHATAME
jgi:hypothetical protein